MSGKSFENFEDVDFYEIGQDEARSLGPRGNDDGPCAITCYRECREWKSRKAASLFYKMGMMCCGGSEQSRYAAIVSGLAAGMTEVSDGID